MLLEIRRQGVELENEIPSYIERRLLLALGRFRPRIHRVTAYLADLNGPRGGVDKRCRLVARMPFFGIVSVEGRDADWFQLIDHVSDRLTRGIQRSLERKRDASRHRAARMDFVIGGRG